MKSITVFLSDIEWDLYTLKNSPELASVEKTLPKTYAYTATVCGDFNENMLVSNAKAELTYKYDYYILNCNYKISQ